MTTSVLQFSDAKNRLSEIFDRLAGTTRVYRIRHQRHESEVAMLSAELLERLMAEVELLRNRAGMRRIQASRKARREGRLVEYTPKSRR